MTASPVATPPDLETIRSWFPVTRELVYLFNGNINACPTPVRAAMDAFLEVWSRGGDACWEHGWEQFEQSKALFAQLVNTDPSTVYRVRRGDRIAQLVIQRVEAAGFHPVEELPQSQRGIGGFGHTGR